MAREKVRVRHTCSQQLLPLGQRWTVRDYDVQNRALRRHRLEVVVGQGAVRAALALHPHFVQHGGHSAAAAQRAFVDGPHAACLPTAVDAHVASFGQQPAELSGSL